MVGPVVLGKPEPQVQVKKLNLEGKIPMKHLTSVTMPVVSFRHLETPYQRNGYRNYFAVVATKDLPDLSEWRRINVRDPKTKGAVPTAIRDGFLEYPELFLFMNRGLVLSVDSV